MSKPVYVIGFGAVTPVGNDARTTWQSVKDGVSGVKKISRFDTEHLPVRIAAMVDTGKQESAGKRTRTMALRAISEAWEHSMVPPELRRKAGLFLTAPTPDNDWTDMRAALRKRQVDQRDLYFEDEYTTSYGQLIADLSDAEEPPIIVNTACATGGTAIEMATESLRGGRCDIALVGGGDSSVFEECLAKFCLLSALSTTNDPPEAASRPFTVDRDGFVLGEGAGALVLATEEFVTAHGLAPRAIVAGVGNSTDNFHRTRSNPDGKAIIYSMERAIADAGLSPSDISHINAHGTSTPENDKMESYGIHQVFGDAAPEIPLTANKSMVGHSLTTAGLIEAVISIFTLHEGVIPPTINYDRPDETLGVRVVASEALHQPVRHVLSNSFGFGGQNVTVVFSRA